MTKSTTLIIIFIIIAIIIYLWSQSGTNEHFDVKHNSTLNEPTVIDSITCTGGNINSKTQDDTNSQIIYTNKKNRSTIIDNSDSDSDNDNDSNGDIDDENSNHDQIDDNSDNSDNSDESDHHIKKKFMTRDKARDGKYKHGSYLEGKRGGSHDIANDFIDQSNELMHNQSNEHEMDGEFIGNDDTKAKYAPYVQEKKQIDKYNVNEMFNRDNYLPSEQSINPEWWDMPPEPTSVKNRHLINTTKAMPVSTIGSSLRNPGYDIRGSPPCPKFIASPWMQSTIEPDTNLKSLCTFE